MLGLLETSSGTQGRRRSLLVFLSQPKVSSPGSQGCLFWLTGRQMPQKPSKVPVNTEQSTLCFWFASIQPNVNKNNLKIAFAQTFSCHFLNNTYNSDLHSICVVLDVASLLEKRFKVAGRFACYQQTLCLVTRGT